MHFALRALMLLVCAAALAAPQQPAPQVPRSGLETDWDIAVVFQQIGTHAAKMLPALDKIDAKSWMEKGAPDAYMAQLQSSKDQARSLVESSKVMAKYPTQLSASIEFYFRIQGLETMVASLAEAIRKYQTPADAQNLIALTAENGANRDRVQKYIVNLAAEREQDLKVMDREAQRCRGLVTETSPTPPKGRKK